jgi:hypothetical protein
MSDAREDYIERLMAVLGCTRGAAVDLFGAMERLETSGSLEMARRIHATFNDLGGEGEWPRGRMFDVDTQAELSRDPQAARDLCELVCDISEDCYAAGWMRGIEYELWATCLNGKPHRYGQSAISDEQITKLRDLHARCDGWWYWHDDTTGGGSNTEEWGPRFVTTTEWTARLAAKG